mgnify:CR=1 FL=1
MPHSDTIPVSASIASTGKGIRYIGEHCYAFSGNHQISSSSAVDHLSFTTGTGYILAELNCNGSTSDGDTGSGQSSLFHINFNDLIVAVLKTETSQEDMPADTSTKIIIPPLTTVKIDVLSSSGSAGFETSVVLTGRVYGAE